MDQRTRRELQDVVARAIAEDVGAGDLTTLATVPPQVRTRATMLQKEPGVIFGLDAAELVFRSLESDVRIERPASEGEWREGGPVLVVEGFAQAILARGAHRAEPRPAAERRGDAHRALRP